MHAPRVWGGGLETHLCELTSELLARNVKAALAVCPKFGHATGKRDYLLARGAEFVDMGDGESHGPGRILEIASRRRNLSRVGSIDSIVCHGTGMSHIVAVAGRPNARLVWHDHSSGGETVSNEREFSPPNSKRYSWPFRRFVNEADAVITGSEQGCAMLRDFQSVKSPIHVIPPLCVLPKYSGQSRRQRSPMITCGTFGNLGPEKGTECLLRLWTHPDLARIRLLLFGNDHEGRYERLAGSLGLKNVEFRGPYYENSFAQHAADIDFAVIASVSEGYALVAIELMALGVPLVATKVGVCPELDTSGEYVILVEHNAGSVQSGILRMVRRIEERAVDGDAIRQRASESYNRRSIVDRYLQVIGI